MNKHSLLKKTLPGILPLLLLSLPLLAQRPASVFVSKEETRSEKPAIEFVPEGGFHTAPVSVQLLSPGAAIYFTADGTTPREDAAHRYTRPFFIDKTTVIRALAVVSGERSYIFSSTYFVNEPETNFPVVSISIAPGTLFDPVSGLFREGPNASDSSWMKPGANFWSRREVSANVEIFEGNGKSVWSNQSGMRIFGGVSRLFPQKSLAIVARERYGESRIKHPIFGKKGLKKFKYLVLRNSGSDFGKTHFRDGLMTHLVKDWDLDMQDYRPSHVYLNGEYWGIYNLREKINRYFIAGHHNVDRDSLDLIEHQITRQQGSTLHYRRMLGFMRTHDLANPANYARVNALMEVGNFMDYQIAQIFFDNQDAGGNIKFWRPQTETGRWRWILYDTDWGFGMNDPKAYRNNSLEFHTATDGPTWPNPPWSTFILRNLLKNKDFERRFLNRFADYLNSDLEPGQVLAAIDKFHKRLQPEMPRHLSRWKLKTSTWEREVNVLRTFAKERPAYMRRFLMERFDVGELRKMDMNITHGGQVVLNENVDFRDTFSGYYFEKIPIRLKAMPDLGYRFVRWKGQEINSESPELMLQLTKPEYAIEAVFEKFDHPLAGKIIINEVSCHNKQSGDWVELFNRSKERVDLQNWILTDSKNEFRFPKYILPPGGYVVVCEDSTDFLKMYPKAQSLIGGLSFGLNKRQEVIQLFSPEAAAVDSVSYVIEPMDTVFSINLLLPTLDNGDPGNWEITIGAGSPGAANAYYVSSRIQAVRKIWMQIGGGLGVMLLCLFLLKLRSKGKI